MKTTTTSSSWRQK